MGEPTRILKSKEFRELGAKIAFNYDDLRRQCDQYVQQARQQASRLLDEARHEAAELRQQAHRDGYAEGRRAGLTNAAEEIQQRAAELADQKALDKLQTTLPALRQAAELLAQQRDAWLANWEQAAVRLAIAVAEKIVRRELDLQTEHRTELIRATLELATGSPRVKLRLNPRDAELLGANTDEVVRSMSGCGQASVVPDDDVTPGGCLIETEHGEIDGRLETQLERITSELLKRD